MQDRILGLLGLAARAGKSVSGEQQTVEAIKSGEAKMVIVAQDASDNTKKLFSDKCNYYKVPVYYYGTRDTLGNAIGKIERSSVAVNDKGFAEAIKKLF